MCVQNMRRIYRAGFWKPFPRRKKRHYVYKKQASQRTTSVSGMLSKHFAFPNWKTRGWKSGLDNETGQISLTDSRKCVKLCFNSFLAVMLEAPDVILTERSSGKKIDPVTGGNVCMIITLCLVHRVGLRDRQATHSLVRMHFIIRGTWQHSTCLLNPNRAACPQGFGKPGCDEQKPSAPYRFMMVWMWRCRIIAISLFIYDLSLWIFLGVHCQNKCYKGCFSMQ